MLSEEFICPVPGGKGSPVVYSFLSCPSCNRQKCCWDGPSVQLLGEEQPGRICRQPRKEKAERPSRPHLGGPEQPGMLGAPARPEGHPRCRPSRKPASSWAPAHLRTGWPAGKRGEPFPLPGQPTSSTAAQPPSRHRDAWRELNSGSQAPSPPRGDGGGGGGGGQVPPGARKQQLRRSGGQPALQPGGGGPGAGAWRRNGLARGRRTGKAGGGTAPRPKPPPGASAVLSRDSDAGGGRRRPAGGLRPNRRGGGHWTPPAPRLRLRHGAGQGRLVIGGAAAARVGTSAPASAPDLGPAASPPLPGILARGQHSSSDPRGRPPRPPEGPAPSMRGCCCRPPGQAFAPCRWRGGDERAPDPGWAPRLCRAARGAF